MRNSPVGYKPTGEFRGTYGAAQEGKERTRVNLAIAIFALPYVLVSPGENSPLTKAAQTSQLKAHCRHPR
jgi:hypothetical protein